MILVCTVLVHVVGIFLLRRAFRDCWDGYRGMLSMLVVLAASLAIIDLIILFTQRPLDAWQSVAMGVRATFYVVTTWVLPSTLRRDWHRIKGEVRGVS